MEIVIEGFAFAKELRTEEEAELEVGSFGFELLGILDIEASAIAYRNG